MHAPIDQLGLTRPVAIYPSVGRALPPKAAGQRRVAIVTPCFNAPADLALLYSDLTRLELGSDPDSPLLDITLVVVDNASDPPLERVKQPAGLDIRLLRMASNGGGSGGYNAGMAFVIQHLATDPEQAPEFVWLLDSDARPDPDALLALVSAMDAYPEFGVIGSSIAHPETGVVFEIGGKVGRWLGQFGPCYGENKPAPKKTVEVGYAAACSALVRTGAIAKTGLFPEVFLNADDVEWCYRIVQETGLKIGASCESVVRHPQMKFGPTMARYFQARNCFGPIDALKLGPRARFMRAMREVPRALAQTMIGRDDLAELHLRGLADAAAGRLNGPGAMRELQFERFVPFDRLADRLKDALPEGEFEKARVRVHPRVRLGEAAAARIESELESLGIEPPPVPRGRYILEREGFFAGLLPAIFRLLTPPRNDIAIVPARGRPNAWARGRIIVQVTPDGFVLRRLHRPRMLARAASVMARGLGLSLRLALRRPAKTLRDRLPDAATYAIDAESLPTRP